MSTDCRIFTEKVSFDEKGFMKIISNQIIATFSDFETIEKLQNNCDWHVSSECGFNGEIMGNKVIEILSKNKPQLLENIKIFEDDCYKIEVSY